MTNQERGYYSNMLTLCKPADPSKVSGAEAVAFFKKSGVAIDKLKQIWVISARTSNDYLTKDEFYVALRLIAYAQNNIEVSEQSIMLDIKVIMPEITDQNKSSPKQ